MLSLPEVAEKYRRDGFVAVPNLLEGAEVAELIADAAATVRGDYGQIVGAAAAQGPDDDAVLADVLAVHFPHKISPLALAMMTHPKIVEILTALIGPNVKAMQTMLFVKRAGKPGQAWHQDEFYIPTRDRSLCGAWIALDDATVENGCLWMQPGSQAPGVLYPMEHIDDARFDGVGEAVRYPYERESGIPVPLAAGGVAFFNGYVLHRSLRNEAPDGFRRALVIHYCSAESLIPWSFGQEGGDTSDFRDIRLIAGSDPYSWKGTKNLMVPFVRHADPRLQRKTHYALLEAQEALRTRS